MLGYHQTRDPHVHGLPSRRRTMSERSMTDSHGQPGILLTLSSVRSRRHSYHSQADSAGSIPVTRSVREKRGSRTELVDSRPCQSMLSVLAWATLGHTYPHLGTHLSGSEDAQLLPSRSPASVLRSSKVTRVCLRNHELNVNGLNYSAAQKRDR